MDNARPHHSKCTVKEVERLELRWMPHPRHNPDTSSSDFWLVRLMKRISKRLKHMSGDDLSNSRSEIVTEITREQSFNVYREWIKRLPETIRTEGKYRSEWYQKFLILLWFRREKGICRTFRPSMSKIILMCDRIWR
jgi:hypothetical protein